MNLLVSTNVYKPGQLARVIPHLHAFRGQIGVELFPMFDADCYEEELLHCLPEFEGIPVSFHGPYYETEHSAAPGTPEYAHSMDLIRQTLPYCVRLQSQYLVFHHNNIPYLLIFLIPFVWYCVLANHSYIHVFFTYRDLAVAVCSLECLCLGIYPENEQKHSLSD